MQRESPETTTKNTGPSRSLRQIFSSKDAFFNYIDSISHGAFPGGIIDFFKVFIVAARKFMDDDCLTKASSIAYSIIISLVPTLAVLLTFYSVFTGAGDRKDELFAQIENLLQTYRIRLNLAPIFGILSRLIDNAAKIGGANFIFLIFTATTLLRSLEEYLNGIWRVQAERPLLLRFVYYWCALTLGPLMAVTGTTVAGALADAISSPAFYGIAVSPKKEVWVVGSKATILAGKTESIPERRLPMSAIDFRNQRRFILDRETGLFTESQVNRLTAADLRGVVFRDIQFYGHAGWIIGEQGIMLITRDGGDSWQLRQWDGMTLYRIHMTGPDQGFIAAGGGLLLETGDGGASWQARALEKNGEPLRSMAFLDSFGIAIAGGSDLLITRDRGVTWELQSSGTGGDWHGSTTLNGISIPDRRTAWVVGNGGALMTSTDAGRSWDLKKYKQYDYTAARFFSPSEGFIASRDGVILHTRDGGYTWEKRKITGMSVTLLTTVGERLWALGGEGLLMHSRDGNRWQGKPGGDALRVVFDFLSPFVFLWVLFTLLYLTFPNTRVSFGKAALGAVFTGVGLAALMLLFVIYIRSFASSTFLIYGALSAIPLFLLLIYIISLIILYGAEVSYTLMNPESYASMKRIFEEREQLNVYCGVAIMHSIYTKFDEGKGATGLLDLAREMRMKLERVRTYIRLFQERNLVMVVEEDKLLPAVGPEKIKLADIMDAVYTVSLAVPQHRERDVLHGALDEVLLKLREDRYRIIGETTLLDLMKRTAG